MNRLDRFAIFFVLLLVVLQLAAHYPSSFDNGAGRRPLPAPEAPTPEANAPTTPAAPAPLEPPPDRVRRPLPAAAPNDPAFTVETETLKPGMIAFGTSFPIAAGTWLTARHVANRDCQHVVLLLDGRKVPAQIAYLHPQSDLALLKTPTASGTALPLETGDVDEQEIGFSFGFPKEQLGATEDQLMGRSRMTLGGHLGGTGPMLTWAETARFPDSLPALSGMSGGPMLDQKGKVVGIMVAASVRRGRVHTVAPEVLQATEASFNLDAGGATPAQEVEASSVSLGDAATALSRHEQIVETACVPAS